MPKIINTFSGDSPLIEALNGFAGSFGQNTPQTELYRQKAYGLSRDNRSAQTLQDFERNNPNGYDPNNPEVRAAIVGLDKPAEYAQAQRLIAATRYGAADPRATNTYMGAGGSYGSTVQGTNSAEANKREIAQMQTDKALAHDTWKTNNTPFSALIAGIPTTISQGEAIRTRAQPILPLAQVQGGVLQADIPNLSTEQRARAGGYDPKNPANIYTYQTPDGRQGTTIDGRADTQTGEMLPGGTKVMKLEGASTEGLTGNHTIDKQLLDDRTNKDIAIAGIKRLQAVLSQPNADQSVGYLGTVARGFTDLRAQVEATSRLFGSEPAARTFVSPENKAAVDQVMTSIFTPQLSALAQARGVDANIIRSQVQDLAYMIAKSQDPGGRVSTDDIRRAGQTVGGMIMDPKASVAVLDDLKKRLEENHAIRERNTKLMFPGVRTPTGQPGTTPAAAPAQAAPSIRIDVNGNIIP